MKEKELDSLLDAILNAAQAIRIVQSQATKKGTAVMAGSLVVPLNWTNERNRCDEAWKSLNAVHKQLAERIAEITEEMAEVANPSEERAMQLLRIARAAMLVLGNRSYKWGIQLPEYCCDRNKLLFLEEALDAAGFEREVLT